MAVVAAPLVLPAANAVWTAILFVGSALATAAGISVAADAIQEEFSDAAPSCTKGCSRPVPAPPPPRCAEILALIRARVAELQQRYAEMLVDKHGLYPIRPTKKPPFGSWDGHVVQYEGQQKNLIKLIRQAVAQGCPVPPDAEEWATRPPPARPLP
jgi:hypothetical protein